MQPSFQANPMPEESSQRVRYSTSSQLPAPAPGNGSDSSRGRRRQLTLNQWTLLAVLAVVGFTAVALAAGVLAGGGTRTPPVLEPALAGSLPEQAAAGGSASRINLRPTGGVRVNGGESERWAKVLGPGKAAPGFRLPTLEGGDLTLADFHGQTVVVNFWATWCTWCRYEMPALEAVHRKYRKDGLVVVGIDVAETRSLVEAYVQRYGISFPIALDMEGGTAETYQVRALPMTYFVSGDGDILRVQRGAMREDELELYVRDALAAY
jgi:thiol-disulfide isomerase/thioredoxin